jgi:hypothetical protein
MPQCGRKEVGNVHDDLVPLDGSPLAERALPYAERLARATGRDPRRAGDLWDHRFA